SEAALLIRNLNIAGWLRQPPPAAPIKISAKRSPAPGFTASCVDGPRLARGNAACRTEVACSHVSGLFTQSGWTAGPHGVREPRPHHSSGIDVPMKRQVSLGCFGSTDCAITRHYSLASSSAKTAEAD